MANPTTNYGFIMPTSTDLVTDLPADFNVFGQAVDTQMLTNANAAIAKTIVDAKGDIIAATAADAVSRLAVGANNTVLTADSTTATGLKWAAAAGGGDLIKVYAGSFTSVSGFSLPDDTFSSTYLNYRIIFSANNTANSGFSLRLRAAGSDNTASNYRSYVTWNSYGGSTTTGTSSGATSWDNLNYANTGNPFTLVFDLLSPKATAETQFLGIHNEVAAGGTSVAYFNATTAFDSLSFILGTGNMTGTVKVYGYSN